jgi:hypothetical protein
MFATRWIVPKANQLHVVGVRPSKLHVAANSFGVTLNAKLPFRVTVRSKLRTDVVVVLDDDVVLVEVMVVDDVVLDDVVLDDELLDDELLDDELLELLELVVVDVGIVVVVMLVVGDVVLVVLVLVVGEVVVVVLMLVVGDVVVVLVVVGMVVVVVGVVVLVVRALVVVGVFETGAATLPGSGDWPPQVSGESLRARLMSPGVKAPV